MATIDSFFKPKLHRPNEAQGPLHLSLINDIGPSAVTGKDSCNQNSEVKAQKLVSLNDSLEDFESSSKKKLTPKPRVKKKVSSNKATLLAEKKVVEISYADFLKGKNTVGTADEEKEEKVETNVEEKSEEAQLDVEKEKVDKKEKEMENKEMKKETKKPKSAFDLLKWNNNKKILLSEQEESDSEDTLEASSTKPAKSVATFFKKVNKSEAFLKAKVIVEVKAEVYAAPSLEERISPSSCGSLKKHQKFQRTNVAVVDDDSLKEIENPEEEKTQAVHKEVKRKLDVDGEDDCMEQQESALEGVKEEATRGGKTVDERATEEPIKGDMDMAMEEGRSEKGVEKTDESVCDGESKQASVQHVSCSFQVKETTEEEDTKVDTQDSKVDKADGKIENEDLKIEIDNEEMDKEEIEAEADNDKTEKENKSEKEDLKTEIDIKELDKEEIETEMDNEKTEREDKCEKEDKVDEVINVEEDETTEQKRIELVHLSDEERDIPSPVVFIESEIQRKSIVEIVSDDEKLMKESRVTLMRADTNKMQATLSFGAKGMSIKRPVKTQKKVTKAREKSDEYFQTPKEKKVRRSCRAVKKVVSVRRSARLEAQDSETEENFAENEEELMTDGPEEDALSVMLMPPRRGKKKTPLKIRFTRSGSDSNADDSPVHSRKDPKLSRAQELVKKAKEKKVKKILQQSGSESLELRRSCRRSAHVASQSISLTMEEISRGTKRRLNPEVKSEPTNKSTAVTKLINSAKKTANPVKLASIFQLNTKKNNSQSTSVVLSEDEAEIEVILTEEEKERQRLKKQFLFSSIPTAVKKQLPETVVLADLAHAPWPTISHVQQISEKLPPWCLDPEPSLPLAFKSDEKPSSIVAASTTPGMLTHCCKMSSLADACPPREKFSPESLRYLLAEVKTNNTAFPVYKCFRQLQKLVEPSSSEPSEEEADLMSKDVRRSRRGLKRNRDTEKVKTKPKVSSDLCLQWTEKYAPGHSSDFFCNSKAVKRLHSWLSEWKHRTDVDLRRAIRAEIQRARRSGRSTDDIRKKYADALWTDDLDNFDVSGDSESDQDEGEDTLCNTMLVQGPHGCGKTSVVYALAQELGYKVFEVNASSKRSGRQIISELQEATQSHQVSMQKSDASNPPPVVPKTPVKAEKGKKASSFFSKNSAKPFSSVVQQEKKPKVETVTNDVKKKVNLSGVSLILFEEVDVVLEEDRGFWSAVQTFIQTTKRPILLTASDAHLADKLTCKVEKLQLKAPSVNHLASYLQLVCLQEGLRTSCEDLTAVSALFKGDIRRSLLSLQFWVQSGIRSRSLLPVTYNRSHLRPQDKELKEKSSKVLENNDSLDHFDVAPRKKRRKCRTILDEDSEREVPLINEDSQGSIPEFLPFSPDVRGTETIELFDAPHVNRLFMETLCNVAEFTGANTAVQCLRLKSKDASAAISVSAALREFSINLVHSNLPSLLPLKRTVSNFSHLRLMMPMIKPRSRISNTNDLFDSEESEDGFPSLKSNSRDSFEPEKIEIPGGSNTDEKLQKMIMAINDESFDEKHRNRYIARSLHSMASMYDALSFTDTLSHKASFDGWGYGAVTHGDLDHVTQADNSDLWEQPSANEMASTIEVLQLRRTNSKLRKLKDKICKYSHEEIQIPVDRLTDCVNTLQEPSLQISSAEATQRAGLHVRDNLPVTSWCDHRSLSMDYLPILRFICHSEQLRAAGGRKRRFLHYLDPLIRELRESILWTLCSAF